MPYTVHLLSLKCVESQELDGDDVYVKLNGSVVWSSGRFKMHNHPTRDDQVDHFDFANGKRRGKDGWQLLTPYNPKAFIFPALSGDSFLEIWERDRLTDDLLGKSPISERDIGRGDISIVFARSGAYYLLTYRVAD